MSFLYPTALWGLLAVSLPIIIHLFSLRKNNNEIANIIPIVGLFSAAAYRLLPSITRILRSFQAINFSRPIIETLSTELNKFDNDNQNTKYWYSSDYINRKQKFILS